MLAGDIDLDIERLKKRKKKTAISITVNTENLDYIRKNLKKRGVGDIKLSPIFDMLLEDLVKFLKKEEKNNNAKKS